jgi:hypothetical protein
MTKDKNGCGREFDRENIWIRKFCGLGHGLCPKCLKADDTLICKCGHDKIAHTFDDINPECVDCDCSKFEPKELKEVLK